MFKWLDGKNLIDLISICVYLWFFGGDVEKGVLVVLRCEICYNFMMSKCLVSLILNLVIVVKKGLGG